MERCRDCLAPRAFEWSGQVEAELSRWRRAVFRREDALRRARGLRQRQFGDV